MAKLKYKKAVANDVRCQYCGQPAVLRHGDEVYPLRSDLHHRMFWVCKPCKAWVGTHKGTDEPLGVLANAELRAWKQKAHSTFDPLWQEKLRRRQIEQGMTYKKAFARGSGYKWLAEQLGINRQDCHIGMFTVEQCKRVVELCEQYRKPVKKNEPYLPNPEKVHE